MRNDSRLSRMLHVLIHMDRHQHSATSEMIAKMLNTNPVVVRRTMAGLREQGYVRSEKGHGGGWTLVRPLSKITLLDVYRAIGEPHLFAIGPADDQPQCLVEQAVNIALGDAMKEAQSLLLQRLGSVTLDEIAADFEAKLTARSAASYSCAS